MKEHNEFDADDAEIEALLRSAGPRAEPSPRVRAEVEAAVHDVWREVTTARRKRHTTVWAMAASVGALALATVIGMQFIGQPGASMATLQRADGDVMVADAKGNWTRLDIGQQIAVGYTVRSTATAAFKLDGGVSLRLDQGTAIEVKQIDQLALNAGAVYVDSAAGNGDQLQIRTVAGSVRHLGTQYQVRVKSSGMDVSVREGRVEVAGQSGTNVAAAGERLSVSLQGVVQRSTVATTDDTWRWASEAAPVFAIENASLSLFLEWIARETGRKLVYTSDRARTVASGEILHGTIEGLTADAALAAVLASTPLRRQQSNPELLEVGLTATE